MSTTKKKKKNQASAGAPAAVEETKKVSPVEDAVEETDTEQSASEEASAEHADEAHGHDEQHDALEEDRPQNGLIALVTLITVAVVVTFVVGVRELFNYWGGRVVHDQVLAVQSSQLRELRSTEQQKLNHYQWASKQDGVVRIPVDRAVELTVAAYRAPVPPPAPTMLQEVAPAPKPEDVKPEEKKKGEDGKSEGKKDEKKDEKKGDAPKEPHK